MIEQLFGVFETGSSVVPAVTVDGLATTLIGFIFCSWEKLLKEIISEKVLLLLLEFKFMKLF